MSKGLLLLADSMDAALDGATTFAIPVSAEMSPAFRLVVLGVTRQGEIVSDAVWVPVEGLSMHKVYTKLYQITYSRSIRKISNCLQKNKFKK